MPDTMRCRVVMVAEFEIEPNEGFTNDFGGTQEGRDAFDSPLHMLHFLRSEIQHEYGQRHGISNLLADWFRFQPLAVGDDNYSMTLTVLDADGESRLMPLTEGKLEIKT